MSYGVNDEGQASGRVPQRVVPGAALRLTSCFLVLALAAAGCGRSSDAAGDIGDSSGSTSTTAAVVATSTSTTIPTTTTTSRAVEYVVQSGDSLSIVAERFGLSTEELANFNAITDANSIQIGQTLAIPPVTVAPTTTVSEETTTTAS